MLVRTSTIQDGNMSVKWGEEKEVLEHRKKFLGKHGLRLEDTVVLDLLHDDAIVVVDRDAAGMYVRAEAVLTREKGLPLMLLTADCNPVVLHDPVENVLAIAHLSWQTATLHLGEMVVQKMQEVFGTNPANVHVSIGPSARKESYIQTEVQQRSNPNWAPYLKEVEGGTAIDVLGFTVAQFIQVGVQRERIVIDPTDTIASEVYFSHYRAVRTKEEEGRFATVAVLQ